MGRAKATNKSQPNEALKEIDWAKNDYELVFALLGELERPVYFKVLFGKKEPSEVRPSRMRVSYCCSPCFQTEYIQEVEGIYLQGNRSNPFP